MASIRRIAGLAVFGVLAGGCAIQAPASGWSSQMLMGTTPLGDAYADFLSARYAGMVNDPETAADYYRNAWLRSGADPDLLDRAALSLLLAGEPQAAAELAAGANQSVLAEAPFAILILASDQIETGDDRNALRLLEKAELGAMESVGRALQVWLLADRDLGAALELAGAPPEAGRDAREYADCMRGLLLASAKRDQAALEAFDRGGDFCRAMPVIAAAHLRTAVAADGAERARAMLARLPDDVRDSVEVVDVMRRVDGGGQVRPVRLSTSEGAALGLFIAVDAIGADTSGQLGAVFYQMMHRIDPASDLARISLANAHFELERYDAAISYAGDIKAPSAYARSAQWERARALIALKRNPEALASLRDLAASSALPHNLSLRVADAFRLLKANAEAEQVYTRLLDAQALAQDRDWRPFLGRASARQALDRWDEAEADLLAALDIEPEQPDVLNFLGYGWVDQGKNVEAGFDMIRKAIARRPNAGYIIDSLGWAHFRMGQYEEAASELERAAELQPGDAEIIDHLGDAYWRAGRRLEAGFEWKRALSLDPDADLVAELEGKLARGLPEILTGSLSLAESARQ